ncbi:hypothetical protein [Thalassomonas sp. M1454]|uniref:hypothetical protein n=1 Tax=Thalassomonas sp. M1454 TaxID=2594477 RepID=UPI00117DCD09|nr:hypothetical protein [Thalassomonas sp. M1454]TRX56454.1 hypothetical protein FNN08_02675 [Thalassomonas sp. M1454]
MKNEKKYLFDDPKNIKRLMHIFYACCVVLVVLDFVIHRHVMHDWENLWAFYPIYGFIGCVVLVVVASWMRTFLIRSEDYYDKPNTSDVNDGSVTDTSAIKGANHVDD